MMCEFYVITSTVTGDLMINWPRASRTLLYTLIDTVISLQDIFTQQLPGQNVMTFLNALSAVDKSILN